MQRLTFKKSWDVENDGKHYHANNVKPEIWNDLINGYSLDQKYVVLSPSACKKI